MTNGTGRTEGAEVAARMKRTARGPRPGAAPLMVLAEANARARGRADTPTRGRADGRSARTACAAALVTLGVLASARLAPAQCPDGTPPPCAGPAARGGAAPSPNSVAVLYLDNLSRDTSDAYLADGLTEEIILRLQQVRRLEVRSRFESQRVRGRRGLAPATLGRELAARYLVDGTIQREGERLVVRVELTRADRGIGVWSGRFDRTGASVLDIIDDVARGVATGIAGELLPAEAAQLARRPTSDPLAYEHFVRGNFYLAQRAPDALARAADEYGAAYARDGELSVALGRIAYAWALGITYGMDDLPADTVRARAAGAVERAMRQAPGVSDTWLAAGFRHLMRSMIGEGDFVADGVAALAHAAQLDPASAEAHHQYAQSLVYVGRDSAAFAEYRRALALEPGRAVTYQEIAFLLVLEGRYREAIPWCDSALAADPRFVRGYLVRGRALLLLGDLAGAEREASAALALAHGGDAYDARALESMLLAARGDTAAARSRVPPGRLSGLFGRDLVAVVGDEDRVSALIEQQPSPALRCHWLRYPGIAALRSRPRFERR